MLLFYFSTEEPETAKRCCPCKKHGPVGGYGYKPKYGYKPQNYYYQPQNDYYQPPQYGLVSNYGAPQYEYGLVSNYETPQYGGDYSYGKHIYIFHQIKFGLSEKHTKFGKIFLMVWTFTK